LKLLKLLLDKQAEVNAIDSKGMNALLYACSSNTTGACDLLIKGGALVNCLSTSGLTPLHYSAGKVKKISYFYGS
jgi:ankyrin repeat protein